MKRCALVGRVEIEEGDRLQKLSLCDMNGRNMTSRQLLPDDNLVIYLGISKRGYGRRAGGRRYVDQAAREGMSCTNPVREFPPASGVFGKASGAK